jgi:hypothetical protein
LNHKQEIEEGDSNALKMEEDVEGGASGALKMGDDLVEVESNALKMEEDVEGSASDAVKVEEELEDIWIFSRQEGIHPLTVYFCSWHGKLLRLYEKLLSRRWETI